MARVKKTMELVEKSKGCIDGRYDICSNNINDLVKASCNTCDLTLNSFRFGYMQGIKATESSRY